MDSLKVIGPGFYHNDVSSSSSHVIINHNKRRTLFPRLKRLHSLNLGMLRDWVEPPSSYEAFPCLEKLQIWECPLLVSAPTCFQSLSSLSVTRITSWEAVMKLLQNTHSRFPFLPSLSTNLASLSIVGVGQPTNVFNRSFQCSNFLKCNHLAALRSLEIEGCPTLGKVHGLESCVSMKELTLRGNSILHIIPDLNSNLSRLTSLTLFDFSQQMSLPEWLSCLPSLQILEIGGLNEEVEQLDDAPHLPKCLTSLTLRGWPKLSSLPEWLSNLSSLQILLIEDCVNLKYLPSVEAMGCLTQLWRLGIRNCPILKERCREDGGEEWLKISHIRRYRNL